MTLPCVTTASNDPALRDHCIDRVCDLFIRSFTGMQEQTVQSLYEQLSEAQATLERTKGGEERNSQMLEMSANQNISQLQRTRSELEATALAREELSRRVVEMEHRYVLLEGESKRLREALSKQKALTKQRTESLEAMQQQRRRDAAQVRECQEQQRRAEHEAEHSGGRDRERAMRAESEVVALQERIRRIEDVDSQMRGIVKEWEAKCQAQKESLRSANADRDSLTSQVGKLVARDGVSVQKIQTLVEERGRLRVDALEHQSRMQSLKEAHRQTQTQLDHAKHVITQAKRRFDAEVEDRVAVARREIKAELAIFSTHASIDNSNLCMREIKAELEPMREIKAELEPRCVTAETRVASLETQLALVKQQ
ncbi:hypothetical protein KIPB_007722, partial [Kipferlia bialata]|eukprot:g7722.t1